MKTCLERLREEVTGVEQNLIDEVSSKRFKQIIKSSKFKDDPAVLIEKQPPIAILA